MTTCLCNIVLTAGADRMAATDPHGWTLTIISVGVVFIALIILYGLYSLSGRILIALALDMENGGDTYAAIATAVHLYLSDTVHDTEPGIVTITRKDSAWNNKELTFRRLPR